MSELNQRARARVKPLIVKASFPTPVVSMALAIAVSPLTVAVTFRTPNTTVAASPLAVTVTLVTPTVVLV